MSGFTFPGSTLPPADPTSTMSDQTKNMITQALMGNGMSKALGPATQGIVPLQLMQQLFTMFGGANGGPAGDPSKLGIGGE